MGATDISTLPQRNVILPTTVFRSGAATDVPLVAQGATGQTGNLFEWRDVGGTVLGHINGSALRLNGLANLQLTDANSGILMGGGNRMQLYAFHSVVVRGGRAVAGVPVQETGYAGADPSLVVFSAAATQRAMVVQGAASQSAVIQEWTNSAGTRLAALDSGGTLISPSAIPHSYDSMGTGVYNRTVIYHNTSGLTYEMGKTTDAAGGTTIPFIISQRGGGDRFRVESSGQVNIPGSLQVISDTANQGNPAKGLMVGNDLWIYDVNVGNSIGFSGAGNPEAANLYLGRASNAPPVIAANDVNKTIDIYGQSNNSATGQVSIFAALWARRDSGNSQNPGPHIRIGSDATTLVNSAHNGWIRFYGFAQRHGEITFHPGEAYYRFRTSGGADFDGWAYLLANQFYAQSTEASKSDIQTLTITGSPTQMRGRASAGTQDKPLKDRFKELRPVSYKSRGNEEGATLHSFVAEEAYKSVPEIVALDADGKPTGINLMATISILTAMVQDQQQRIEQLEAK